MCTFISLLIEKPFYLLRPQSFSFQIVSEFIDIFVKFSNFHVPGVELLSPCSVPSGGLLSQWLSRGEGFCSLQVVSRGLMVLDEIDTYIWYTSRYFVNYCFLGFLCLGSDNGLMCSGQVKQVPAPLSSKCKWNVFCLIAEFVKATKIRWIAVYRF